MEPRAKSIKLKARCETLFYGTPQSINRQSCGNQSAACEIPPLISSPVIKALPLMIHCNFPLDFV